MAEVAFCAASFTSASETPLGSWGGIGILGVVIPVSGSKTRPLSAATKYDGSRIVNTTWSLNSP